MAVVNIAMRNTASSEHIVCPMIGRPWLPLRNPRVRNSRLIPGPRLQFHVAIDALHSSRKQTFYLLPPTQHTSILAIDKHTHNGRKVTTNRFDPRHPITSRIPKLTHSLPGSGAQPSNAAPSTSDASRPKPCCVCKDEKAKRDECMLFSNAKDPQQDCVSLVDQYKSCMSGFGYKV